MKVKILTLLSVLFMLSACGQGFVVIKHGAVDPEFEPYVEKFMEHTNLSVVNVDMYFDDQSGNIIGLCRIRGLEKDIKIDPIWWNEANELDREILIFHELAHCVLNQGHRDFNLSDKCPGSVMGKYHIGSHCYRKHYDYYIKELFYENAYLTHYNIFWHDKHCLYIT